MHLSGLYIIDRIGKIQAIPDIVIRNTVWRPGERKKGCAYDFVGICVKLQNSIANLNKADALRRDCHAAWMTIRFERQRQAHHYRIGDGTDGIDSAGSIVRGIYVV